MPDAAFEYRVRVSPRSQNVRLRVTARHGLEVVIPRSYDPEKVPNILERKKNWINAALERAATQRKFFEPEPSWKLPSEIKLAAIGKTWHVTAKPTGAASVVVRELGSDRLLVFGNIENESLCREALTRWLLRKTREYLVPRLEQLSERTGLRYIRTFVKRPKTRWASCSRHRSISLNAKLLFLPFEYVDYVLIHELCHLTEMNHSKRFWALVEHHSPEFRKLDKHLREMWKTVPRWAYRSE
jgi:predicted metal-dependent hydrolase